MTTDRLYCICCDRPMENIMRKTGHQPMDGVSFYSEGHYGTSFFDPMDGSSIQIAVCDPCIAQADAKGVVRHKPPEPRP